MTEQPWDSARLKALDRADGAEKRLYFCVSSLVPWTFCSVGLYIPGRTLPSGSCADLLVGRINVYNTGDRCAPSCG